MSNAEEAAAFSDHHRPTYHFLPPRSWINDPNGLIHFRGEYHLFYQHNPQVAWWGPMSWGHARSRDLVHWEHLPIALAPDQPYDSGGVWSGCAVDTGQGAAVFYTGVEAPASRPQTQCLATSEDMVHWRKHPGNPVVKDRPPGVQEGDFRDPCVFRHGDGWLMVVGANVAGIGAALLYASDDLVHWRYLHPLLEGDKDRFGYMWECPNFFPLGDRWVLLVSAMCGSAANTTYTMFYFVGRFEGLRMVVEHHGPVESGDVWAPQVFGDAAGRRIMFMWIKEARGQEACLGAGWAGCLSLPRELSLGERGQLLIRPAAETGFLRAGALHRGPLEAGPSRVPLLADRGECIEIVATVHPGSWQQAGLEVLVSPDGQEKTRVYFDKPTRRIVIDRDQSSLTEAVWKGQVSRELGDADGPVELRVFVDHSVIEVYVGGLCLSARAYPRSPGPVGLAAFAAGGPATFGQLDVWQINGGQT